MIVSERPCPVCGAGSEQTRPFLKGSYDPERITALSYASRKMPEYMSHPMVQCQECDLVYVDRPPSQEMLAESYHQADYDSADEAEAAADSYAEAIAPVLERLHGRGSALEIGTGTGAFLERLEQAGITDLAGVEPSQAALDAAPPKRRAWIKEGIFEPAQFEPESFDLICCFMTLEHVRDPGDLVRGALPLLRPGGAFVSVTHDYRAPINRLLGKRSPIVDIEHMQLFSHSSAQQLLARAGYEDVGGRSFRNSYRPSYWLRLAPLPTMLKTGLISWMRESALDRHRLSVNVGNVMSWGFKPASGEA